MIICGNIWNALPLEGPATDTKWSGDMLRLWVEIPEPYERENMSELQNSGDIIFLHKWSGLRFVNGQARMGGRAAPTRCRSSGGWWTGWRNWPRSAGVWSGRGRRPSGFGAPDRRSAVSPAHPAADERRDVVRSVIGLAGVIRGEVALSFLGLGVQRPTPSWSRVLRDGFQYLATAPWVSLAPGAAIFLTVFVFHQLGDLIRDTLDPRALSRTKAA